MTIHEGYRPRLPDIEQPKQNKPQKNPKPATFGTLAAIPFYLLLSQLSLPVYGIVLLLASVVGVWLCGKTAKDLGVHDHPGIVWDEFCGYWLTM
jgi:phosphatidylglycerophosphatase A